MNVPSAGAPAQPLGEVLDFLRLLWRLDHALQRRSKRMEATLGLTSPQRLVVRIVGRFPGIPAGHLAELLHVHPSTLTGVLQRLDRQGLVRRRADPRDRRRSLLSLTDAGRRIDVETEGTIEAAVQRAIRRVSPAVLRAAGEVLSVLSDELDSRGG